MIKAIYSFLGLPVRDVRVPTRLQFQTTECGVAALAMVLAHHGRHVSTEELRGVTGASRDCVNAAEMARAARQYGLECKAYTREPDALADLPRPFLAHLRFIHFVVVEGISATEVLICDPHAGRSRIAIEKFAEDFTGIVLAMKPGPGFVRDGASTHPARSLLRRIGAECNKQLIAASGSGLVAALLVPAWALLLGLWVDSLGNVSAAETTGTSASTFAGLMLCLAGLHAGVAALQWRAIDKLRSGIATGQAALLARRFMSLPAGFFVYRLPSKLHQVLYSSETIGRDLCLNVLRGVQRLCILPVCLIAIAWLHPGAALAIAALAVACIAGTEAIFHLRGDGARQSSLEMDDQLNALLFGREELEQSKLGSKDRDFLISRIAGHASLQRPIQDASEAQAMQSAMGTAYALGAVAIALFATSPAIGAPEANLGPAAALIVLSLASAAALRQFAALRGHWDRLMHVLLPVDDVLASKPSAAAATRLIVNPDLPEGTVLRASALTFGYSRTRAPLIRDISLSLKQGEQLGLTGPSGGGKSTLAGLLAGDHQPWSGTLEVSPAVVPRSLETISSPHESRTAATHCVAWVDKSSFFFEGTVRENLCLWETHMPEERLRMAISDACLDEVIAARPGALDAPVTERGRNFSGGQRQRLEIARALLRDPKILILDEATDALDPALEARIRANIRRRGCTLVMVSHRACTLAACERVLRIAGGAIAIDDVAESLVREDASTAPPAGPPVIDDAIEQRRFDPNLLGPAMRLLAQALGVSPAEAHHGEFDAPANDIVAMARRHGLQVRAVRFAVRRWWRRNAAPLLAFRRDTGDPVVLLPAAVGARIIDPATSRPLPLRAENLAVDAYRFYRGIGNQAETTSSLLVRVAHRHSLIFIGAAVLSGLLALCVLVLPALAWRLFDPAARSTLPDAGSLALGMGALVLAAALFDYCRSIAVLRAGGKLESDVNAAFVQRLPRLSPAFCLRTATQDLAQALTALQRLFARLRGDPLRHAFDVVVVVAISALIAWIDARVAAIAGLLAAAAMLLPWALARDGLAQETGHEARCVAARRFLIDVLNGIFRLRLLASSKGALERWIGMQKNNVNLEQSIRHIDYRYYFLKDIYPFFGISIIVAAGTFMLPLEARHLPALLLLLWPLIEASLGVGATLVNFRRVCPLLRQANLLATAPMEPAAPLDALRSPLIELRDVAYRYPGTTVAALAHVSLTIQPGEFVAITGPSGGGKSTLLRMLLGMDEPQSGTLLLDALPVQAAKLVAWRRGIGMVSQDDRTVSASTLRSQVSGTSPFGVLAVWEALQTALLSEDIRRMPMGLQTIVESGKLSTGQEQRLLVARELLRRPSVLILDEATNAIPDALQAALFDNLRKLGITCILVTHRETAIERMDRVMVLENGIISWSGTAAALREERHLMEMLRAEREEGHL